MVIIKYLKHCNSCSGQRREGHTFRRIDGLTDKGTTW